MARWLARTSPSAADIVWAKPAAESEIEETLSASRPPHRGRGDERRGRTRLAPLAPPRQGRPGRKRSRAARRAVRPGAPAARRARAPVRRAGALDRMATRGGSVSNAGPVAVAAPVLSRDSAPRLRPSRSATLPARGHAAAGLPPAGAGRARPRADRRGSRGDGHSAPRALRLLARQCRRRPRGGPRARPPDRADRPRPARAPAASRLLRLPGAQERGSRSATGRAGRSSGCSRPPRTSSSRFGGASRPSSSPRCSAPIARPSACGAS